MCEWRKSNRFRKQEREVADDSIIEWTASFWTVNREKRRKLDIKPDWEGIMQSRPRTVILMSKWGPI